MLHGARSMHLCQAELLAFAVGCLKSCNLMLLPWLPTRDKPELSSQQKIEKGTNSVCELLIFLLIKDVVRAWIERGLLTPRRTMESCAHQPHGSRIGHDKHQ